MRSSTKKQIKQGEPQVNYREALTNSVEHRERLKKQSGGSGLFADMEFELGPATEEFLESDGSMHAVDSKPIAFELCAKEGFKAAAKRCKPVLLEPIMKLEVTSPEEYTGGVIGDLNRRRGLIKGQDYGIFSLRSGSKRNRRRSDC